jgi:hypothetical protein
MHLYLQHNISISCLFVIADCVNNALLWAAWLLICCYLPVAVTRELHGYLAAVICLDLLAA